MQNIASILWIFTASCSYFPTGDVTSIQTSIQPIREDEAYHEMLQSQTKTLDLFANFSSVYKVKATHLNTELQASINKHFEDMFPTSQSFLSRYQTDKTLIFIAFNSPNRSLDKIDNPKIWSIFLDGKEGPVTPAKMIRLKPKERLQSFFPFINEWTEDYLLVFSNDDLTSKKPKLTMSNPETKSIISW